MGRLGGGSEKRSEARFQTSDRPSSFLVFDTHPIQYRSPVFRSLFRRLSTLKVFYFDETFDARKWWFHEVGQIPKQTWDLPLREGFPNEIVGTSALGALRTFSRFWRILRKERPGAVLIYGYYLPEHWFLRLLCAREGIPLIFVGETFSGAGRGWRKLVRRPLLSLFFGGVRQFVAIGDKTESGYRSRGISPERIVPARYCTDVSFFAQSAPESMRMRREWRARLGIPDRAFVVLFVGRLVDRKRPFDILALHRALGKTSDVHTVIVGNGLLEERLRAEGADLPRLHFAGFQNQAQTRDAYHGADLLVVPSEYETWGLVVNEAFACGLPAAVTETCGVALDLVIPEQTGWVFRVGDVEALTRIVRDLASDPELRARAGEAARRKVSTEYTIDRFAEALLTAYRRCPSQPASETPA